MCCQCFFFNASRICPIVNQFRFVAAADASPTFLIYYDFLWYNQIVLYFSSQISVFFSSIKNSNKYVIIFVCLFNLYVQMFFHSIFYHNNYYWLLLLLLFSVCVWYVFILFLKLKMYRLLNKNNCVYVTVELCSRIIGH